MKIEGWVNRTVKFEFVWTSRNLKSGNLGFESLKLKLENPSNFKCFFEFILT